MSYKPGRNDPCPCGSGKKYKHCCGSSAVAPPVQAQSHDGAVERALAWLGQHHRKGLAVALQGEIDHAICASFDDDDEARDAMAGAGDDLWQQVQINFSEWMLAEGDIDVKGEPVRVAELLLGPRGPLLTVGQRAWLEQLARQPLRLYDITDVLPGTSITLCDALATEQAPLVVAERAGSQSLRVGMQLGARVMQVAAGHQLSGAVYPFSSWAGREVQNRMRALLVDVGPDEEDLAMGLGLEIIDGWLAQFLHPKPLPKMMHAHTGEPMVFITDHYDVQDWQALVAALAAQPDVHGDRDAGWRRSLVCDDGLTRSLALVEPGAGGQRVALRYQTAGLAQQGRAWFDALAGAAVKFLLQEVSDPKGLLSQPGASQAPAAQGPGRQSLPEGMDPAALADAIEGVIRRTYARWADEPIPALNDQTPRQAIGSAAGLERVKGLLRSYADGERQQAQQQGRREVSYQFLWDALGLSR